jgi:hypothetical protein
MCPNGILPFVVKRCVTRPDARLSRVLPFERKWRPVKATLAAKGTNHPETKKPPGVLFDDDTKYL